MRTGGTNENVADWAGRVLLTFPFCWTRCHSDLHAHLTAPPPPGLLSASPPAPPPPRSSSWPLFPSCFWPRPVSSLGPWRDSLSPPTSLELTQVGPSRRTERVRLIGKARDSCALEACLLARIVEQRAPRFLFMSRFNQWQCAVSVGALSCWQTMQGAAHCAFPALLAGRRKYFQAVLGSCLCDQETRMVLSIFSERRRWRQLAWPALCS